MIVPREVRRRVTQTKAQLDRERQSYDAHWRDLSEHFAPRRGRFHTTDRSRAGTKRNGKIINNTGVEAAKTLAAGMMAGLTSPARPWFRLMVPQPGLNERADVKAWLYTTEQRMRDVFSKSNLYNLLPTIYGELGTFGTGVMILDEDDLSVIRGTSLTVGSYWLGTSERGVVDTLIREFSMTPRQMVQRFGLNALSKRTQAAVGDAARAEVYEPVWHMIAPNPDHVPGQLEKTRKPILSVYLQQTAEDESILSVGGYDSQSVMAPRWSLTTDDVYGDCPGMAALGDCRALQRLEDRKLRIIDKMSDPPMVGPAELRTSGSSSLPGDVTYITGAHGAGVFQPSYVPVPGAVEQIRLEVQEHAQRINASFYADLFLMLTMSDRRQITAREVEERHEEKLLMLGPVLDRLHDELLNPIIDRTFDIMWRRGMIEPPPEVLQGEDVRPEYISILAQAQRAVATGGIERVLTFGSLAMQMNPEAIDKIDLDQAIDEFAQSLGAPPTMVRSDEAVAALRAARAEQQQLAAMAEQASALQSVAGAAKAASETPLGGNSVLDAILSPSQAAA